MIGHVFGLVGENISLLLTNQHLEEEAPIVESDLKPSSLFSNPSKDVLPLTYLTCYLDTIHLAS